MLLYILLSLIILYIILVPAPAFSFYRSVYGRRKVLPPDDPKLKRPTLEPYLEKVKTDYLWLMEKAPRELSLTAADGITLRADYFEQGSDKTVLMIHGYNADPYINLASQARWFYENGWDLLVIHQRAHSKSGGKKCGMGLLEKDDVLLWVDRLSREAPENKLLIYGISMGGTCVAYISDSIDDPAVFGAVIDCGYISPAIQMERESKRFHLPYKLLGPYMLAFTRLGLKVDLCERTTEHLKNSRIPILFVHGADDPTVPLEQALENYSACGSEKMIVTVDGAAHTTSFLKDKEKVEKAYLSFIGKYMK